MDENIEYCRELAGYNYLFLISLKLTKNYSSGLNK